MSKPTESFQVSTDAAEIYERTFVPALFAEWAGYLVDAVEPSAGRSVLDVACGTGIVARTAADRMGGVGTVVGIDVNEGMLDVARRVRPDIEWRRGDAADLPFPEDTFDVVLCQASLMYFEDRVGALGEMRRVATPEGIVGLQVWGKLESQPAYRRFADIVGRHAGSDAIDLVASYFSMGDLGVVSGLLDDAGLDVTGTETRVGAVRFGSLEEFARAEIDSTPLVDRIDDDVYARILADSREGLAAFAAPDGGTEIPIEGHVITARPR